MADVTTIKGNNNLIIDFAFTPFVLLSCTDNFGNVWSEMNITLTASGKVEMGQLMLPLISSLYPSTTKINITLAFPCNIYPNRVEPTQATTLSDGLQRGVLLPDGEVKIPSIAFAPDTINGGVYPLTFDANGSTISFTSGFNNNWTLPALVDNSGVKNEVPKTV